MYNFWNKLKKPFFVLAPMADVTDPAFRFIIAKYGKPDVLFTQFVSCDGLCSKGKEILLRDLAYSNTERPIVAQFFGSNPKNFYTCAKLARDLKFDGIDINMGCPDKSVMKQNAGASLIQNPSLAKEIIIATKKGAGKLPVSIKTRIGDSSNLLSTWLPTLLKERPAAITIHARTRKELSKVPARWECIKEAVEIAHNSTTLIIGNGDVQDMGDAREKSKSTGADGIMLGKAIFGNPWLFNTSTPLSSISIQKKLQVMVEHTYLYEKMLGSYKSFSVMKKHYKAYTNGIDGAKELRMQLMNTNTALEVDILIKSFIKTL